MLSISSCACWPSKCLLWRNIYLGFCSFFGLICLFFVYFFIWRCMSYLYVLEINWLLVTSFANIFSNDATGKGFSWGFSWFLVLFSGLWHRVTCSLSLLLCTITYLIKVGDDDRPLKNSLVDLFLDVFSKWWNETKYRKVYKTRKYNKEVNDHEKIHVTNQVKE